MKSFQIRIAFLGVGLALASCGGFVPHDAPSCGCDPGFACEEDADLVYRCKPAGGAMTSTSTSPPGSGDAMNPTADAGAAADATPLAEPPAGSYAAPCPNTAPMYQAPCPTEGDPFCVYTYGPNPRPECNLTFFCVGGDSRFGTSSTWFQYELPTSCTTPDPDTEQPACAAEYASVTQGDPCSATELHCNYPQGLCACTQGPGAAGGAGPRHAYAWVCAPPPAATPSGACPTEPPLEGMACSALERECDYGSCTIQNAPVVTCRRNGLGNYAWTSSQPTKSCL